MSSFFKNYSEKIFTPNIDWLLSDKIDYENLLINKAELFKFESSPASSTLSPPQSPRQSPPQDTQHTTTPPSLTELPITGSQASLFHGHYSQTIDSSKLSGSIEIQKESLPPNTIKTILNDYNESKSSNPSLLFNLLLKLETFFVEKHNIQFKLFKSFLEGITKPVETPRQHFRTPSRDQSSNPGQPEFLLDMDLIFESHSSIHSNLSKIIHLYPPKDLINGSTPLLNDLKHFYSEIFVYIMSEKLRAALDRSFSSNNRYMLLTNDSIKERIASLKFFYHSLAHFWVFVELIDLIHRALFQNDKNTSSVVSKFGDDILKGFKKLKDKLYPKFSNNPYILRFSIDSNSKYTTIEFANDKVNLINQHSKSSSFSYQEFSIHHKFQFYNSLQDPSIGGANEKPVDPKLEQFLLNDKNNQHLLFHSKNHTFHFSSKQIKNNEILSILDDLLKSKDQSNHKCNICKFKCFSVKPCHTCNQMMCSLDSSPTDHNACLNCGLLRPMTINARYYDSQISIPIQSTDYRVFITTIYKEFNLPRGSLFNYTFDDYSPQLNIENIYNMMLIKRELDEAKKPVVLNVTLKDVLIAVTIVPYTNISTINSELRDGKKGGMGSVFKIKLNKNFLEAHNMLDVPPLVFKELKLRKVTPIMIEDAIESNNASIERFKYEAAYISDLCKKSKHIIKIYGFCENPLGLILEEAPKGSLNRYQPKSWEIFLLILIDICKGMRDVHNHGIIHRDLKPDNILLFNESLNPDDVRAKIADFGISTPIKKIHNLLHSGNKATPCYVAPEFDKNGNYTHLVDIFTFGLIVFNLLTGKKYLNPFGNVQEDLKNYNFPIQIKTLIEKTTERNPYQRVSSFEILLNELEQHYNSKIYENWGAIEDMQTKIVNNCK